MMNLFQNGGTKTQNQQLPKILKKSANHLHIGASRNRSEQGSVCVEKRSRTKVRRASQTQNVPAQ
jgi:hypothetical protein